MEAAGMNKITEVFVHPPCSIFMITTLSFIQLKVNEIGVYRGHPACDTVWFVNHLQDKPT
jgi:hypothetical protein